ncbi:SfnB family sulfur acquisition oxidoreductase [Roseixanthobacter pseudopolyaromaticivorans]|uniref:SfnB family sulfur acquisition oxidoreductase n=1 Tax=Xanthobacteraceae TaxID=335928 RepID=UPI00372AF8F0
MVVNDVKPARAAERSAFAPLPKPARPAHVVASDAEALTVARALAAEFAPGAAARDAGRQLPIAELDRFSQSGLWSVNVPKAEGGPAVSYATLARMFALIAAADASIAQLAQNHLSIIDLIRFDPSVQKRRFFYRAALEGRRFGNAISERAGKTILDFHTRLIPHGDGFIVRGEKFYCTGAAFAHLVPVNAIGEDGKGRLAFLERDAPGLSVLDDWTGIGQRTTASGTVVLDDVFVPTSHVIESYRAFEGPSVHGPVAQIIQAAIDAGIARGALEETIRFVKTRARPWPDSGVEAVAQEPYVLRDIGDLAIRLHAAEAVLEEAGLAIDAALDHETEDSVAHASIAVAEAKVLATEIALLAGSKLFELSGTRAALAQDNLDRYWRDARIHTLHDPVRWKFHAIGNYALNGLKPPRHSWL